MQKDRPILVQFSLSPPPPASLGHCWKKLQYSKYRQSDFNSDFWNRYSVVSSVELLLLYFFIMRLSKGDCLLKKALRLPSLNSVSRASLYWCFAFTIRIIRIMIQIKRMIAIMGQYLFANLDGFSQQSIIWVFVLLRVLYPPATAFKRPILFLQ